ncbi:GntR family transcriptional regulator [Halochromatium glycolicum]|uniref:GntR family transcriptional regulator n=1 Tax=Halochromatium glycolicum TaxID=85075 RepID=UPI001F5B2A94|nr:winged helix-turn-helix domain-containing protein [Halochromatium glycolicum]
MTELLYEDIAARLVTLIEQGTFAPGARLPGLRKLSRQFSVSVGTVVSACALLEAQGVLIAQPRSGHYVADRLSEEPARPEVGTPADGPALIQGQERVLALVQAHNDPALLPFGAAVPDASFLPVAALARSAAPSAIGSPTTTSRPARRSCGCRSRGAWPRPAASSARTRSSSPAAVRRRWC